MPVAASIHVQELSGCGTRAPYRHVVRRRPLGIDKLLDQGWDHMAYGRVELVAGPVEVGRKQVDAVLTVLLAIGLGMHEQCLLGDAIRGVRLLGIPVPQLVLMRTERE